MVGARGERPRRAAASPGPVPGGEGEQDAALVAALRRRDEGAFETLVRRHGGRLLLTARRLLRSEEDARDALQDALLAAHRSIDGFAGEGRILPWLQRIVINAALMKLRTRRRHPEQSIEELLPRFLEDGHQANPAVDWDEPLRRMEQEETRLLVRRSIDALPEGYRTVLLLRDIQELDTEETAEAMGMTANAVKTRLHRARQALRALLDPHFRGGGVPRRGGGGAR